MLSVFLQLSEDMWDKALVSPI